MTNLKSPAFLLTAPTQGVQSNVREDFNDSTRRVPVPQRRWLGGARRMVHGPERLVDDPSRVDTDHAVRPMGDGDGALRARSQREAGNTENRGFFLNATRIRQDEMRPAQQGDEVEVSQGIDVADTLAATVRRLLEPVSVALESYVLSETLACALLVGCAAGAVLTRERRFWKGAAGSRQGWSTARFPRWMD